MKIAPSIFAADLGDVASGLRICEAGGADMIHVDVMDGHFVPNLSFGPLLIEAMKRRTEIPLDVHLMVSNPGDVLDDYLELGPAWVSVHQEAATHLDRLLGRIRETGAKCGVALNPATPWSVLGDVLPLLDFVLLMSVNPGFSGQAFIPYVARKASSLKQYAGEQGLELEIEMDGGVASSTLETARDAGVDMAVVGSGIFGTDDPVATLKGLRSRASEI